MKRGQSRCWEDRLILSQTPPSPWFPPPPSFLPSRPSTLAPSLTRSRLWRQRSSHFFFVPFITNLSSLSFSTPHIHHKSPFTLLFHSSAAASHPFNPYWFSSLFLVLRLFPFFLSFPPIRVFFLFNLYIYPFIHPSIHSYIHSFISSPFFLPSCSPSSSSPFVSGHTRPVSRGNGFSSPGPRAYTAYNPNLFFYCCTLSALFTHPSLVTIFHVTETWRSHAGARDVKSLYIITARYLSLPSPASFHHHAQPSLLRPLSPQRTSLLWGLKSLQ